MVDPIAVPADARLISRAFSPAPVLKRFTDAHPEAGAIASFVGKVRPGGGVRALELTHYEPLTLPGIEELLRDALERWPLDGALAWHRIGRCRPGAPIVLVAAAARHRRATLEAVDFMMDHLKSAAWFWKRELRADGWHWIEPTPADHSARQRWS